VEVAGASGSGPGDTGPRSGCWRWENAIVEVADLAPELDATQLLGQIYELWVHPELERRRLPIVPEQVTKALVVMAPGRPVSVLLDDEVRLMASVRATRRIAEGESITAEDFDELRGLTPAEIDPDAGWVCFARLAGNIYVAFDFRRNREKARRMLDRADEFLAAAKTASDAGQVAVAVDCGYAAAELAVTSQMLQVDDAPPRDHHARRRWFADWTRYGNVPSQQSRAFAYLAARRGAARYADGSLKLRPAQLRRTLDVVGEAIQHARARVAEALSQL
jgi:HEPN domain-containing protein